MPRRHPLFANSLIDLLLASGARPGEFLMLTIGMTNRSGEVWIAELRDHNMVNKGKARKLISTQLLRRFWADI